MHNRYSRWVGVAAVAGRIHLDRLFGVGRDRLDGGDHSADR